MDKILFQVQYITKPAGKVANKKRNIKGRKDIIFACIGSGGAGFNFCCKYIVKAISIGQAPIIKKEGGIKLTKPNKLKIVVGSGADRSLIHP